MTTRQWILVVWNFCLLGTGAVLVWNGTSAWVLVLMMLCVSNPWKKPETKEG